MVFTWEKKTKDIWQFNIACAFGDWENENECLKKSVQVLLDMKEKLIELYEEGIIMKLII